MPGTFTGMAMAQALGMILNQTKVNPESTLLHQIGRGDHSALQDLYIAHGRAMYAYAFRLLRDQSSAEEVVQDSLVAIWQGAKNFRGDSRVLTWILGIVYHKSMNLLRQRTDLPLDEAGEQMISVDVSPGQMAEDRDRIQIIQAGMQQLPVDQRSVLELVFFHRLSMEEAGRVMDCPQGTIKSRLFSARNALKGILTRQGYQLEDLL